MRHGPKLAETVELDAAVFEVMQRTAVPIGASH